MGYTQKKKKKSERDYHCSTGCSRPLAASRLDQTEKEMAWGLESLVGHGGPSDGGVRANGARGSAWSDARGTCREVDQANLT